MTAAPAFDPTARLQSKSGICAYLGGISPGTYDKWHKNGIVPGPVKGTNFYDVAAHDAVLDRVSGMAVNANSTQQAFDDWKSST